MQAMYYHTHTKMYVYNGVHFVQDVNSFTQDGNLFPFVSIPLSSNFQYDKML